MGINRVMRAPAMVASVRGYAPTTASSASEVSAARQEEPLASERLAGDAAKPQEATVAYPTSSRELSP